MTMYLSRIRHQKDSNMKLVERHTPECLTFFHQTNVKKHQSPSECTYGTTGESKIIFCIWCTLKCKMLNSQKKENLWKHYSKMNKEKFVCCQLILCHDNCRWCKKTKSLIQHPSDADSLQKRGLMGVFFFFF